MSLIPIVLDFWFNEAGPDRWFTQSREFDDIVLRRFFKLHEQARDDQLYDWETTPEGCVALCLLLDQFPRNMFRGTPRSFATDADAYRVAQTAVTRGFDIADGVGEQYRLFLYLPFEHSEDIDDQNRSCELFAKRMANPDYLKWAEEHRAVIERFGRFPQRNRALGRRSTPEELEFLEKERPSF